MNKIKFVNWNDKTINISKRKVAYVKWLMKNKKLTLDKAKLASWKKFRSEEDTYTKTGHALWVQQNQESLPNPNER